ncbi:hypothetical protein [Paraburkholderia sp.]|uniref:hypothetical protein n=1 Tax=Paraburkholderia sp. TaxID=1926495 RepID=UPI003D701E77
MPRNQKIILMGGAGLVRHAHPEMAFQQVRRDQLNSKINWRFTTDDAHQTVQTLSDA